jgi:hypothetical protein
MEAASRNRNNNNNNNNNENRNSRRGNKKVVVNKTKSIQKRKNNNRGGHNSPQNNKKKNQRRRKQSNNNNHQTYVVRSLTNDLQISSKRSIQDAWKKELGGLIRWYMNLPQHREPEQLAAARRVLDGMRMANPRDVQELKYCILRYMLEFVQRQQQPPQDYFDTIARTIFEDTTGDEQWVRIRMVVENPHPVTQAQKQQQSCMIENVPYETIVDGRWVVLKTKQQSGEGPAHTGKTWTVVIIPDGAVGRQYVVECINRSTVDLSVQMSIDGHEAAKNAPLPAQDRCTIKPDVRRYFEAHEWRLVPSRRIPLPLHHQQQQQSSNSPRQSSSPGTSSRSGYVPLRRYNERIPNYQGQRVPLEAFPDLSSHGWRFTGSHEPSKVEFFEKKLNNGSICKMDFYYTTATVITILHHPKQNKTTQLFRRCLDKEPETFLKILENPRYHSGFGYYRQNQNDDDPPVSTVHLPPLHEMNSESDDEEMDVDGEEEQDDPKQDGRQDNNDTTNDDNIPCYAKNDKYSFDSEGHANRQAAMEKLQSTPVFQAWENATKQDWACIHAKFFVSLRRYTGKDVIGKPYENNKEQMHVPEMTPVVQVQAAKRAVVSTQFHVTGPSTEPVKRSHVRMERIKGLNDDPAWGTGPVFDLKLYYQLEGALNNQADTVAENETVSELDGMDEDDDDDDDNRANLAEELRDAVPLEEYKKRKVDQLVGWYQGCKAPDNQEANAVFIQIQNDIESSTTTKAVDGHIEQYLRWHQQYDWSK